MKRALNRKPNVSSDSPDRGPPTADPSLQTPAMALHVRMEVLYS